MNLPILPSPSGIQAMPGFYSGDGEPKTIIDPAVAGKESYRIEISPEGITLRSSQEAGLFWARQSLRQLRHLFPGRLPCCVIEDTPAFAHRGVMIDCVRHFFPIRDIKAMLESAALFKINTFHWHLTDDQGWRVPIDRYPKLISIGSKRSCSNFGRYYDKTPYSGYYTKDEIRDILEFCAQRHIEVIPEIEMPGHVSALLAAYPELSCTGDPVEVKTRGGVHKDILCAGNDEALAMMKNILLEIIGLFPGEKIHIGGDEAPRERWKACPRCRRRIEREGLKNESELQCWFTNQIAAFLKAHGKTAVVWNDALKGGSLSNDVEVQYWIGDISLSEAFVNEGGSMIMSDYYHYYLDYSYGQLPPGKVAQGKPVPDGITPGARRRCHGVEAPLWAEYIENLEQWGHMAWPRLAAVAETGWSPQPLPAEEFLERAKRLMPMVEALGVPVAPEKLWNLKKAGRIRDALRFWYHAMTWKDFRAFLRQMKLERQEAKENETKEAAPNAE